MCEMTRLAGKLHQMNAQLAHAAELGGPDGVTICTKRH
jgi:hypothetical protein